MLPLAHFNKTAIVTVGGRCDHGSTTLEVVCVGAGGKGRSCRMEVGRIATE